MTFNKVRRFTVSHPCHGVSPWWSVIRITSPGLPTFATLGNPESRASQVAGRRTLFETGNHEIHEPHERQIEVERLDPKPLVLTTAKRVEVNSLYLKSIFRSLPG